MLGAVARRWRGSVRPDDKPIVTLAPYRVQRTPRQRRRRIRRVVTAIALVGAFYGFLLSFLPMAFYLYLALPIAVLALIVIWALPQASTYPEKTLVGLFFALFMGTFLWPNYLAISLPGLPWITIMRLISVPMCLIMLVSLSTSAEFRRRMWEPFLTTPWLARFMLGLIALLILTLPFSSHIAESVNRVINWQFQWTAMFFLAAFVFSKPERAQRWVWIACGITLFLTVVAVQEFRLQKVLWADHIPSFLAVQDENVLKILSGARRSGAHRVQSIFATSLSFAEFIGLMTAFFIYLFLTVRRLAVRIVILLYIPFSFWMIDQTDSRVGTVAFFASFLLYFVLWAMKNWIHRKQDVFAPMLVLAYPAMVTAFLLLSLFWVRLHDMIWGTGEQQASNEGRKAQYREGIPKILSEPWGHGAGESGTFLGFHNLAGTVTVDTYYLAIAADFGILGFFCYYGLVVTGIWQAIKHGLTRLGKEADLLLAAAVMLTTFIITNSVLAQSDTHTLAFVVLGMVAALAHYVKTHMAGAGGGRLMAK